MAAADDKDAREKSTFVVFWTSLPGILTGVGAVIGALAALIALFVGNGDSPSPATSIQTRPPPSISTPSSLSASPDAAGDGCLGRYFKGVSQDRITRLEVGAIGVNVTTPQQPTDGTVGLRLTKNGHPIGALRFDYVASNRLFKIQSVVDARCKVIEDYANTARGEDKQTLQNYQHLRLRLGGASYDVNFIGYTDFIQISFGPGAP